MHTDYTGQGVDQLKEVIHLVRNNPDSRRIILCAWNPSGQFLFFIFFIADRLFSAILRSLEQTHCARMWFTSETSFL